MCVSNFLANNLLYWWNGNGCLHYIIFLHQFFLFLFSQNFPFSLSFVFLFFIFLFVLFLHIFLLLIILIITRKRLATLHFCGHWPIFNLGIRKKRISSLRLSLLWLIMMMVLTVPNANGVDEETCMKIAAV